MYNENKNHYESQFLDQKYRNKFKNLSPKRNQQKSEFKIPLKKVYIQGRFAKYTSQGLDVGMQKTNNYIQFAQKSRKIFNLVNNENAKKVITDDKKFDLNKFYVNKHQKQ